MFFWVLSLQLTKAIQVGSHSPALGRGATPQRSCTEYSGASAESGIYTSPWSLSDHCFGGTTIQNMVFSYQNRGQPGSRYMVYNIHLQRCPLLRS